MVNMGNSQSHLQPSPRQIPNQNFKMSLRDWVVSLYFSQVKFDPWSVLSWKRFGFPLITALFKAGPCTTALAVCLKQKCHVTWIKQLWNIYSANLFLYQPHFGADTDEPWKNFTHWFPPQILQFPTPNPRIGQGAKCAADPETRRN